MKELVFQLPQANRLEIGRFHELAEALSRKDELATAASPAAET